MADMERVNAYEKLHEALDTIKGHGEAGKERNESTMADFHCCVEKYHELRPDDAKGFDYNNLSPEGKRDLYVAAAGIDTILASVSDQAMTDKEKAEIISACGLEGLNDTLGYFHDNDQEHIKDNPCIDASTEGRMQAYYSTYSDDVDPTKTNEEEKNIHNYLEMPLYDDAHVDDASMETGRHEPEDEERSFLTVSNDEKASAYNEYIEAKVTNNDTAKEDEVKQNGANKVETGTTPVTADGTVVTNKTTTETRKEDEAGNKIAGQIIDVAMSSIPGFEPEKNAVMTAVENGEIDKAAVALGNLGNSINQSESNSGNEVQIRNIDQAKLSALADLVSITFPKREEGKAEKIDLRNPWQLDAMQDINRMASHLTKDEYKAFTGTEKPNPVSFVVQAVGVFAARIRALDPANIASKYTQALYQGMMAYDTNKKDNIEKTEIQESRMTVEEMKSILTDTVQFATIAVMDITGNDDSAISKELRELLGEHEFESVKADLKDALDNNDRDKISKIEDVIKDRIEQEHKNDRDVDRSNGSYTNRLQSLAASINRSRISGDSEQKLYFGRLDTKDTIQTFKMMATTFAAWREGAKADITLLGAGTEKGHQVSFGDCISSVFTFINSDIGYTLVKYCCEKVADICRDAKTDYKDFKPEEVEKIVGDATIEAIDTFAGNFEPDVERTENGDIDRGRYENIETNDTSADGEEDKHNDTSADGEEDKHDDTSADGEEDKHDDTSADGEEGKHNDTSADGEEDKHDDTSADGEEGKHNDTSADGEEGKHNDTSADGEEGKHDDTTADGEEDKHDDTSADGEEGKHDDTTTDGGEGKHDDTSADGEEGKHDDTTADGGEDKETGTDTGDEITEKEPVEANELEEAGEVPQEPVDNRGENKKAQEDQNAIDVGMAAYGEAEETKVEPTTEEVAENDHTDNKNEVIETNESDSSSEQQDVSSVMTTDSDDPAAIPVDTNDASDESHDFGIDGENSKEEANKDPDLLDILANDTSIGETPEFKEAMAEYASGDGQEGMADIFDRMSLETFTSFDEGSFAQSVLDWTADAYQNGEIAGDTVAGMIDSAVDFYDNNVDKTTTTAFDNAVDFATNMVEIANTALENGDISLDTAKEIFENASDIATADAPDEYDKNDFINDCINEIGRDDFHLEMLDVINNGTENANGGGGNNGQSEEIPTVNFEGTSLPTEAAEITAASAEVDLTTLPNVDAEYTGEILNKSEVETNTQMNGDSTTDMDGFTAIADQNTTKDPLNELTTQDVGIPIETETTNIQIPETNIPAIESAELLDVSGSTETPNAVETGAEAVQTIGEFKPEETDLSNHYQQDAYEQPIEEKPVEQTINEEEDTYNDFEVAPTSEM